MTTAQHLADISSWLDEQNAHRDPEARTWGRLAKIAEEGGEVIANYIGATGQNPRKGVTRTTEDVIDELLDVAITSLGAVEHMAGNDGTSISRFESKLRQVWLRAQKYGLVPQEGPRGCPTPVPMFETWRDNI